MAVCLGEFNGMSSQSHVSHCRVLPLGEFTVTFPEPHATLQGVVTWRNQCRDRATLQGVRNPSAILKIVFAVFYFIFLFLMQFRLWERRLSYRLRYTCYIADYAFVAHLGHCKCIDKPKMCWKLLKRIFLGVWSNNLPIKLQPQWDPRE